MSTGTGRAPKRNGRQAPGRGIRPRLRLWHPDVPGPLWNGRRRVELRQIKAYCQVLAREFQPQKIILFGSYAAGSATQESDVDLVIVLPFRGSATDKVVEIRGRVEAPFPMDLLVWRPADQRRQDSFTRAVVNEGKVMYEAGHP
jgi:predicted nucleotidyltransferase